MPHGRWLSTAERNLLAEVRAIEEGHHARLDRQRHVFLVVSDTIAGRTYEVTAHGVRLPKLDELRVGFSCTCPAGGRQVACGVAPCKHSALVARRLERAGLIRFDGRVWICRDKALMDPKAASVPTASSTAPAAAPPSWAPSPGEACASCGRPVDSLILIPVGKQRVVAEDGLIYHRAHRPTGVS